MMMIMIIIMMMVVMVVMVMVTTLVLDDFRHRLMSVFVAASEADDNTVAQSTKDALKGDGGQENADCGP